MYHYEQDNTQLIAAAVKRAFRGVPEGANQRLETLLARLREQDRRKRRDRD